MMNEDDKFNDCGIDGEPDDPVLKREFNRWVRRVVLDHVKPLKIHVAKMENTISEHLVEEKIFQARVLGILNGIRYTLLVLTGLLAAAATFIAVGRNLGWF